MRSGHNMRALLGSNNDTDRSVLFRQECCRAHTHVIGWVEIKRAEDGLARNGIQPQNGEIYASLTSL
jgi:hypothetical protein